MTTEELKTIQDWYQGPWPYSADQLEKDVRALLGEVGRLRGQNQILRDALVAVVAAEESTPADLRKLYTLIYRSNASHDTKARSIQAIRALLATMP